MSSLKFFLLLSLFFSFICSFEKIDQEIFELQAELREQEGPESSFYSLLGLDQYAKTKQIVSAFRKLSRKVHPDKDSSTKATKRYALLSNVHKVLKHKESRKRYDHFLNNGFPVWKGTGYMYSRHRPGVLFVIFFLVIVGSGTQYLVQRLSYSRNKDRIEYILEEYSKTLNSRDQRQLREQIERKPGTPANEDILPPEFDLSLIKEPTVQDILILRLPRVLLQKFGVLKPDSEKSDEKSH